MAPPVDSEHTTGRLFFANGSETRGGKARLTEHIEGLTEPSPQSRKRTVSHATNGAAKAPTITQPPHSILKYSVHNSLLTEPELKKKKAVHFPKVALAASSPPSNRSHSMATRLNEDGARPESSYMHLPSHVQPLQYAGSGQHRQYSQAPLLPLGDGAGQGATTQATGYEATNNPSFHLPDLPLDMGRGAAVNHHTITEPPSQPPLVNRLTYPNYPRQPMLFDTPNLDHQNDLAGPSSSHWRQGFQ